LVVGWTFVPQTVSVATMVSAKDPRFRLDDGPCTGSALIVFDIAFFRNVEATPRQLLETNPADRHFSYRKRSRRLDMLIQVKAALRNEIDLGNSVGLSPTGESPLGT
jgi:hypothetical protein